MSNERPICSAPEHRSRGRHRIVTSYHAASAWRLADLAGMHGVTISKTRAVLTRLHRFGWLDDGADTVTVRLGGCLTEHTLARLHPTLVDHYLSHGSSASDHDVATEGRRATPEEANVDAVQGSR